MHIKEYLEKHNMDVNTFCSKCRIRSTTMVYSYMNRKHIPSLNTAENIEKATNGEITIKELREFNGR